MMENMHKYFEIRVEDAAVIARSSGNALPASNSEEMYEFERRAIFSKRWLFISHKSRLTQTGDWLRYSFANYDIVVTRDRIGDINTFHNVCRHRAYPVIEKEGAGNSKILACRYHGWSYGLNGKLAKAPGYQEMNLDKDQNSLFRCHTKFDSNGFIWINMDARQSPEIAFEEHFNYAKNQHPQTDFDDYTFEAELKREELEDNWKNVPADSIPDLLMDKFDSTSTEHFPNASSTVSSKFLVIRKVLPQASNKTTKHYEIYRHKDCSDSDWEMISSAYSGALEAEKAVPSATSVFQLVLRDAITEHHKQEQLIGKEIWPAKPTTTGIAGQADEDEVICAGLGCGTHKDILAW